MVFAFSYTTTDGSWGQIDAVANDGYPDGAYCDGWGKVNNSDYTIADTIGVIYNRNYGPGGATERYVRNAPVCGGDPDGDGSFGEWTRTTSSLWGGLGSHTSSCATNAPYIYISEYIYESISGDNRIAVEIFNKTGAAVSTTGWSLLMFTADNAFTQINLTTGQTIANDDVWVMVNNAAAGSTTQENQTFANNDDYRTVVLIYNYTPASVPANGLDFDWPDSVQDDSLTDENQVRYGRPENVQSCPTTSGGFLSQSGFGFEGIEDRSFEPAENQPFPIGRFCHYNNPIYQATNALNTVPLLMNLKGVTCPAGWTLVGSGDLTFPYTVNLDETTNNTIPCAYGNASPQWPGGENNPNIPGDTGPNRNGCADMVKFTTASNAQTFTCQYDATHTQNYTVSILGFTNTQAGGSCPDTPVGTIVFNQIYTAETAKNCFCVYAAFTRGQITPVVLKSLSATAVENGILVAWETATETNNLGFNVYRAEAVDGERALLNPELIMSKLAPGDMFGATYEYLDEGAQVGVTYYYWLEDVPLESGVTPGIYGPISAVR